MVEALPRQKALRGGWGSKTVLSRRVADSDPISESQKFGGLRSDFRISEMDVGAIQQLGWRVEGAPARPPRGRTNSSGRL